MGRVPHVVQSNAAELRREHPPASTASRDVRESRGDIGGDPLHPLRRMDTALKRPTKLYGSLPFVGSPGSKAVITQQASSPTASQAPKIELMPMPTSGTG